MCFWASATSQVPNDSFASGIYSHNLNLKLKRKGEIENLKIKKEEILPPFGNSCHYDSVI